MMFGEIGGWFFKGLGGILPDEAHPGFKNVLLKPNFVSGLSYFNASHDGPYGKIVSSWSRKGQDVIYNVTIPANSSATITFPNAGKSKVYLNNVLIKNSGNYKIAAGSYQFRVAY